MKNIIANQFPFLLDRNTNTDETLNISLWNGIMFVEFPDGEEITFEPTEQQLDWFEGMAESTASQVQVAVVTAKELANTSIPLPKHVGDDETVYLSMIDDRLEISTQYHDQTVEVTAEIRADFDRLAGEPGAKQPAMENSPKKCFKLFSQRVVDGFYVHLYNETYENPEQSHGMWQGHDASQERCIFMTNQDGSHNEGLWAENWESAKNAFRRTHANAYELDKNTLLARVWDEQ